MRSRLLVIALLVAAACGNASPRRAAAPTTSPTQSASSPVPGSQAPAPSSDTPNATAARATPAATARPTPTPAPAPKTSWIKGVDVTAYSDDAFGSKRMDDTLARIAADGGNHASIVLVCYMPTKSATTIDCDDKDATPGDANLARAMRKAHELGLKVALKPDIDPADETFRAEITPSSWRAWFDSYKAVMQRYASLAQSVGAEMLVVGTELDSSHACDICAASWDDVITAVKARFSGLLTYAAQFQTGYDFPGWSRMDLIGIDAYFPLAPDDQNPGPDALAAAWRTYTDEDGGTHHWFADLESLSRRHGKPLIFTEIGYANGTGTAHEPWDEHPSPTVDEKAQSDAYEAMFRTFAGVSWFRGVLVWEFQADREPSATVGHDPRGFAAENVLRAWFAKL